MAPKQEQPPGSRTKGLLITQPVPVAGLPCIRKDVLRDLMNWTELLQQAGIPESPGYVETVKLVTSRPKRLPAKKKGKRK